MKSLFVFLFLCLSANSALAAIYHGIFTGTVDSLSEFAPFTDGDSFTLRLEIDTTSISPLFVGLDINGLTGTFGNTTVGIADNESGIQDRFFLDSALDSPVGIFDGKSNSNVSFDFTGGTSVFSGVSLAQAFLLTDFNTLSGSFDVNSAEYSGNLTFTSGFYTSGSLPPVPLPAAIWLFGSGLLGLIGITRRK